MMLGLGGVISALRREAVPFGGLGDRVLGLG